MTSIETRMPTGLQRRPAQVGGEGVEHRQGVDYGDFAVFHRALAQLCRRDQPLARALRCAAEDLPKGKLHEAVRAMADDVTMGRNFVDSYRERSNAPDAYVATVEAGIECGDLPSALEEIAREESSQERMRERLEKALARPLMSAMVVGVIGTLVLMVSIPWDAFDGLGIEGLFYGAKPNKGISNDAWALICSVLLVGLVVVSFATVWFLRKGSGSDRLARTPLLRGLGLHALRARFLSTLAMLLRRKLPLARALQLAGRGVTNDALSREVASLAEGAERGDSLAKTLGQSSIVSPDLCLYVASCEQHGDVGPAVQEAARVERERFDRRSEQFARIAGPAVELVIGLVVVCFALTYLHPAFRMFSGVFAW